MNTLRDRVLGGVIWATLERFSTQIVSFVVSMALARMLSPSDYGKVALITIFIAIAGVLIDSGFGRALIQKQDATDLDFNSVFYTSLGLSLVVYAMLYGISPLVGRFYNDNELCRILRVLSLTVVFNGINGIQNAVLNRELLFKLSFRITLISSLVAAGTGLIMAYWGYGAWALVWSQIVGGVVGVVVRWCLIGWRPGVQFSVVSLRGLFGFGWKMTVASLLDTAYNNLYGVVIGKVYTPADLAFVNRGNSLPSIAMQTINSTLGRVALPALAKLQDDKERVRNAMRKMIRSSTFFVLPLMVSLAVCAEGVIRVLYGEQWKAAAPYAQLACFSYALWPFHTVNLQGITATGHSGVFLVLECIKKLLGIVSLCATYRYGVFAMAFVAAFVVGPLSVIVNAWPNRKLLNYSLRMQILDVLPAILISVAMAGAMIGFKLAVTFSPVLMLLSTLVVGWGAWFVTTVIIKPAPYVELVHILRTRFQ